MAISPETDAMKRISVFAFNVKLAIGAESLEYFIVHAFDGNPELDGMELCGGGIISRIVFLLEESTLF